MKNNQETEILVYADWYIFDTPQLVGKLCLLEVESNRTITGTTRTIFKLPGKFIIPKTDLFSLFSEI